MLPETILMDKTFCQTLLAADRAPFAEPTSDSLIEPENGDLFQAGLANSPFPATLHAKDSEILFVNGDLFRAALANAPFPAILHAEDGEILLVNRAWTEMTGYDPDELPTISRWLELASAGHRETASANIRRLYRLTSRLAQGECEIVTRAGEKRTWDFRSRWIGKLSDGRGAVLAMATDVTKRKRSSRLLQDLLDEKTILLRESNHRIKNNLQVVSALLGLQLAGAHTDDGVLPLRGAADRVRSIAMLHDMLSRSEDPNRVSFPAYLHLICSRLLEVSGLSADRVHFEECSEEVTLEPDQLLSAGLIVNELVTNALKHAFPHGRAGRIDLEVKRMPADRVTLTVADDGIGLAADRDFRNSTTLGHRLVVMLTEKLGGTLEVARTAGTRVRIEFPIQSD